MAAQHKKHTEAQLSGFYAYHGSRECPSCGKQTFKVTESRKTFEATRRRYTCSTCGFRQTMYEISSDAYEELKQLRSKLSLIRNTVLELAGSDLAPTPAPTSIALTEVDSAIPCLDCVHLTPKGCSFDIPEAQTEEAKGCNLFQPLV